MEVDVLLTVEDARENLCPFLATNLDTCDSIDCMMWRWGEPEIKEEDKLFPGHDRRGYCGLAGKPEYA